MNSAPYCLRRQGLLLIAALTVTGLPAAEVSNSALNFDGTNDYVQAGTHSFFYERNSFTMELWAHPTASRGETAEAVGSISGFGSQRFAIFPDHGDLGYDATNHAGVGLSIGSNGVSVFEHRVNHLPSVLVYSNAIPGWTHVALVYTNLQPRLYVNGTLVRTGLTSTNTFVHPSASLGGSIQGIGYGNYQGQLDEVRIWNTSLSQAQIQANMNRTLAGDEPNLVVYFRCDEAELLTDHATAEPTVHGVLMNGTSWLPSGVSPFQPLVQTLPASGTGLLTYTVHGRFNPGGNDTSAWFEWGTTTNYGSHTPIRSLGDGTSNTNLSEFLSGMTEGFSYHFRAVASNSLGVALGSNLSFTTPVAGYLTMMRFDNIGNIDLLESSKYINDPYDFKCLRTDFSANDRDECDNCGYAVRGLFIPTASGPHTFYISADDHAALFLSPDDSPVKKVRIASEPVWAARRNYLGEADGGGRGDPPANRSAAISLIAGARYYIEGVVQEFAGSDNLDVAVEGPGDAPVADGDRPIFGNRIATVVDRTSSSLDITQNPPPNVQAPEGSTATVAVAVAVTSPLCGAVASYQWQRNGVDIPGANRATYSINVVTLEDHLAQFRAVVRFLGIERVSTASTLEIVTPVSADLGSIGLNFGSDEYPAAPFTGTLPPTSVAGVVPQANWNNLNGASGVVAGLVADFKGFSIVTPASVTWSSLGTWSSTGRAEENNGFAAGGDRTLLTGYLDTSDQLAGAATVAVSGLDPKFTYDVIVYCVGGVAGRGGAYTIGSMTKYGTAPANPATHREDPGNDLLDTGTYVHFRGLSGSSFTLSAEAATGPGTNFRAPINGVQIVGQPRIESTRLPNGSIRLSWEGSGQLQVANELLGNGPPTVWTDVAGANLSPVTVTPGQMKRFYRVRR